MHDSVKLIFLFLLVLTGCSEETTTHLAPEFPQCPPDTQPPSRITDLTASSFTDTSVVLTWTAPGDDGAQGRASFYDLRYTTDEDALADWSEQCSIASDKTPALSGETEEIVITGLEPWEQNYFGLRTADEDSNWANTSNVILVEMLCSFIVFAPVGGQMFCEGDTIAITWATHECQAPTVDVFLLWNGEHCRTIAQDVVNSGRFHWASRQYGTNVDGYQILIRQDDGGESATSEGHFSIPQNCAVQVESPNGGEYFCRGSSQRIYWNRSSCCNSDFTVELLHNFSVLDTLENVLYSGHTWPVESPLSAEGGYQIRVTNNDTGASDVSDYCFQIGGPHPPEVHYPAGGEILQENQEISLSWDPQECTGDWVKIELEYGGEVCLVIAESANNDGSYLWTSISAGGGEDGYRLVITDTGNDFVGKSPDVFTIERICVLNYLTPVAGAEFCKDDPMSITWSSEQWCGEQVKIVLYQGYHAFDVVLETPNDGSYQWTVPALYTGGGNRIRIIDLASGAEVDGPFITLFPSCDLDLNFPAGGEGFVEGLPVTIAWDAGNCCGPTIDIILRHNGEDCLTIADDHDITTGQYEWIAERCSDFDLSYQISIVESGYGRYDLCYPPFSIGESCGYWIHEPNSSGSYYSGEPIAVSWETGSSCGEEVLLEILDEDQNVLFGPVGFPNDGACEILPNQMPGGRYSCLLRISDPQSSGFALSEEFEFLASPFLVNPEGTGDFSTIQEAVDAASEGFEILLADGVYSGTGPEVVLFTTGGFSIGSLSGNPGNCILDGGGVRRVFKFFDLDAGVDVSGLTIRNGMSQLDNMYNGGGVYLRWSSACFSNCIFEHNIIEHNGYGSGAAIYNGCSNAVLRNCVFMDNWVVRNNGAKGEAIHSYCTAAGNPGSLTLENCTFTGNGQGGGSVLYFTGVIACQIEQTIIGFNQSAAIEGNTAGLSLECTDLYMNEEEGWPVFLLPWQEGFNNFSADPNFCNLEGGSVDIAPGSPCAAQNSPCGVAVGAGAEGCR